MKRLLFAATAAACVCAHGASAQGVKDRLGNTPSPQAAATDVFGDDTSAWAHDGECDDPRFEGSIMATTLLPGDQGHDATDCRNGYNSGVLRFRPGVAGAPAAAGPAQASAAALQTVGGETAFYFGDDTVSAFDGVCADPRLVGPAVIPSSGSLGHDAYDCESVYFSGYASIIIGTQMPQIAFGDDSAPGANDGLCADPRFTYASGGPAAAEAARGHDGADCFAAWLEETVTVAPDAVAAIPFATVVGPSPFVPDFGDDTSEWAHDGVCDDNRFGGPTATQLSDTHTGHDATDCAADWNSVQLFWAADWAAFQLEDAGTAAPVAGNSSVSDSVTTPPNAGPLTSDQLAIRAAAPDFGDDSGQYARDGECDDFRFGGPSGMATFPTETHILRDATDCRAAWEAGLIMPATQWAEFDVTGETASLLRNAEYVNSGQYAADVAAGVYDDEEDLAARGLEAALADPFADADLGEPLYAYYFGYDTIPTANNGACEDPRFYDAREPNGAQFPQSNIDGDASDCLEKFYSGDLSVHDGAELRAFDLGDDLSPNAFDGLCDDPRFVGIGAAGEAVEANRAHDALDCFFAWGAGLLIPVETP